MEILWEDGSYTGELKLGEGLVLARDEHISRTNVEGIYYYPIGVPRCIGGTQKTNKKNQKKH